MMAKIQLSRLAILVAILLLFGCSEELPNGGLLLPDNFNAVIMIDSVKERVRHMAVSDEGVLYGKLRESNEHAGIIALKDNDGDGKADQIEKFGSYRSQQKWSYATAMRIYNGYMYFSSELVVYRYKLKPGSLLPDGEMEVVVTDDHEHGKHEHIGKPIAFDHKGNLYVPFGAPSNACQDPKRTPGAPGIDPCPQLEHHGGVWRFDANKLGQTQKDGYKYATGIRSVVAMDWNPIDENLYIAMHGRDDLLRLFPDRFTPWESALLPSEEFIRVTEGSDFGWPYCYYDQIKGKKVLAPEYGGDGDIVGRCADFDDPLIGFPGHWAPNDLVFYDGNQFPERYRHGAFIAFHGSTNRAPYPQSGYIVAFVPFKDGSPSGDWEVFADGFAGVDPIESVKDAKLRPMGIAFDKDGAMYVSESVKGRIWKITFDGDRHLFGENQLAQMEQRKLATHVRTPDKMKDNLARKASTPGEVVYNTYCANCHQKDGGGATGRFPPLTSTEWVSGDKARLISVILEGMEGEMQIKGETYNGVMPQHSFLSDTEIADVLTFVRANFENDAGPIKSDEVAEQRHMLEKKDTTERITTE